MTDQEPKEGKTGRQETKQQTSLIKDYIRYWKEFMVDLFVGTTKRMIISPLVFGMTFMAVAYFIYRLSIKPQDVFFLFKILEVLILFVLYLLASVFLGLLHGANTTLLKKVEELEKGVDLIVDPLMKMIIEKMPGGKKSIRIEEFNTLLDTQIKRFHKTSRSQFRLFSLFGLFSRFFLRNTLRILRYILLHDFLEELQEQGKSQISATIVEDFYREKLVAGVAEVYKAKLELIQYGVYGILVLFLAVPVLLIVVF